MPNRLLALRRHKSGIHAKIVTVVLVLLGVGIGVDTYTTVRSEQQALKQQALEDSSILASILHRTIRITMLAERHDIARELLSELKHQQGLKELQVFRVDGSEAFRNRRTLEEVARKRGLDSKGIEITQAKTDEFEKEDSLRDNPHFRQAVATEKALHWEDQFSRKGQTVPVLTFLEPIKNEVACQGCHGDDSNLRGFIRVSTDLSDLQSRSATVRDRQMQLETAHLVIIGLALGIALWWVVTRRIKRLAEAAISVGQGELDAIPEMKGSDEISQLGKSLRDMTISLNTAHQNLETKTAELEHSVHDLQESRESVEALESLKGQLVKFVPRFVQRLLEEDPRACGLEKTDKDITVLFLDIEGYTRISSSRPDHVIVSVIERYFSACLNIVEDFGGDINEVAGDSLMMIFQDDEDPRRHATNAIDAAIEIRAKAAEFNANPQPGHPSMVANMGINSGVASVGANKFETPAGRARWTFTASGRVTNIAARIGAEASQGRILIGDETARRVGHRYALVDMGKNSLKNVQEPVSIYQVIPHGAVFPAGTFDPIDALGGSPEWMEGELISERKLSIIAEAPRAEDGREDPADSNKLVRSRE